MYTCAPVAFKTWCGHQYRMGIICPPLVEIGLGWLSKLDVDMSPRPHAHRRAWTIIERSWRLKIYHSYQRQLQQSQPGKIHPATFCGLCFCNLVLIFHGMDRPFKRTKIRLKELVHLLIFGESSKCLTQNSKFLEMSVLPSFVFQVYFGP